MENNIITEMYDLESSIYKIASENSETESVKERVYNYNVYKMKKMKNVEKIVSKNILRFNKSENNISIEQIYVK